MACLSGRWKPQPLVLSYAGLEGLDAAAREELGRLLRFETAQNRFQNFVTREAFHDLGVELARKLRPHHFGIKLDGTLANRTLHDFGCQIRVWKDVPRFPPEMLVAMSISTKDRAVQQLLDLRLNTPASELIGRGRFYGPALLMSYFDEKGVRRGQVFRQRYVGISAETLNLLMRASMRFAPARLAQPRMPAEPAVQLRRADEQVLSKAAPPPAAPAATGQAPVPPLDSAQEFPVLQLAAAALRHRLNELESSGDPLAAGRSGLEVAEEDEEEDEEEAASVGHDGEAAGADDYTAGFSVEPPQCSCPLTMSPPGVWLAAAQPPELGGAALQPARHMLYKTELCRYYTERGFCYREDGCSFAHGVGELRPLPNLKTRLCRLFQAGGCSNGAKCWYAHGQAELRPSGGV